MSSNIDLIDIQFKKIQRLRKELEYLRAYKDNCELLVEKVLAGADRDDVARSLLAYVAFESRKNA